MTGPARTGAVIYAKDLARLSAFYGELLAAPTVHAAADYAVLGVPGLQLVVHAIPPHIAETFEIASPPVPRDECALKLFFTVDSLDEAGAVVARLGGVMQAERWGGAGFTACNVVDPEGNLLQLREM